jgi:hypothetical protein
MVQGLGGELPLHHPDDAIVTRAILALSFERGDGFSLSRPAARGAEALAVRPRGQPREGVWIGGLI